MSEWHITPDYIINHWTDELFNLMIEKLVERRQAISHPGREGSSGKVSDKMLFAKGSNLIKVVQSGDKAR